MDSGGPTAGLLRCLTGAGGSAEAIVLRRLRVGDARPLRAAHPRLAVAVGAADWSWNGGMFNALVRFAVRHGRRAVTDATAFATALPRAACGVALNFGPNDATPAAVQTALAVIRTLPPTLRVVETVGPAAPREFEAAVIELCSRMRGLRELQLAYRMNAPAVLATAPPTLRRLYAFCTLQWSGVRLERFTALVQLQVAYTTFGDDALAAVPPSLVHLVAASTELSDAARFAHLPRLRSLLVDDTHVGDAALASAPPRLRTLSMSRTRLSAAARFDHLRRLRNLFLCATPVGDAALASVPRSAARVIA